VGFSTGTTKSSSSQCKNPGLPKQCGLLMGNAVGASKMGKRDCGAHECRKIQKSLGERAKGESGKRIAAWGPVDRLPGRVKKERWGRPASGE